MSVWIQVGGVSPAELTEARLELHHATQLVSIAIGRALVTPRDDDSHTALRWHADSHQWLGEEIPGTSGLRAGLRPADLTLTLGSDSQPDEHRLTLAGKTLADGLTWLRDQLTGLGHDAAAVAFDFHYEMPPHAVAGGAAFRAELTPGFEELGRYFANTTLLLEEIAPHHDNASDILTWPHHFDVGMLLSDPDRGVGPGLSSGDGNYGEPYFYAFVWPRKETLELPPLPHGHWQTEKFLGAVLTATELLEGDAATQQERVAEFFTAAIEGGKKLVA